MKRVFVVMLSLMMAVAFGFTGNVQAFAASGQSGVKTSVNQLKGDYKAKEALVMFKTTKSAVSETKAQAKLGVESGVADAEVLETWDFTEAADGAARVGGSDVAHQTVALVKSKSLSTEKLIAKYKANKDVLYAEPNYEVHALSVTNDTYSDLQWSMQNEQTNVASEWAKGKTGSDDVVVAVVDTGVDYTHEDLADNMWENDLYPKLKGEHGFDVINGDDDPMDDNGHGTHCAGVIGARGNNNVGISGVNQNVKIMALKMLDADGSGYGSEEIGCYNYINKALDLGVPVKAINNSWGGGGESDIFKQLIDVVGEKGAVTVCAAGNAGSDNDKNPVFPADIDSEYVISVAATSKDGTLASFSNYGENTVDVAAPGNMILSTVSYDCFNPSIYTADEKAKLVSDTYQNFYNDVDPSATDVWGIPSESDIQLPEGASADIEIIDGAGVEGDAALKLTLKNMKADSSAIINVPYELTATDLKEGPHYSSMVNPKSPKSDESFIIAADMPASESVSNAEELMNNYTMSGYYFAEPGDIWEHFDTPLLLDEDLEAGGYSTERKVVYAVQAETAGDYEITFDNMAISKEGLSAKDYGKYDYMSGTSMAAPFITGAVALKAAENQDADASELINETVCLAKEDAGLKTVAGAQFDFSQKPAEPLPRISSVSIGDEPGTIDIKGGGLNPSDGLKVEVAFTGEEEFKEAKIVEGSQDEKGKTVSIENEGWINNVVDVRVTGYNGKTAKKEDVYLVKGKAEYTELEGVNASVDGNALCSDGNTIYQADSANNEILAYNPSKSSGDGFTELASLYPDDIFDDVDSEKNKLTTYAMLLGKDLACISNNLYTVAEYGESTEVSEDDEDEDWSRAKDDDDEWIEIDWDEDYAGGGTLYSSDFRLVGIDASTGKVKSSVELPEKLQKSVDYTMAAYNGKLYFLGGYGMTKPDKGLQNTVLIYDPAKGTWTDGPALPDARAAGKALQTGSSLVYTMGYNEDSVITEDYEMKCPANLIFDGKSWQTSSEELPLMMGTEMSRGGTTYFNYTDGLGICKEGLVYSGVAAEDYGDTFTYDLAADKFEDTGYNYSFNVLGTNADAVTVAGQIYAFGDNGVMTAPVNNGCIKVTAAKYSHGKVTGVNRYYNPGDKAKIVAKANKKYKVKSMKVGSKKVKVKKKAKTVTYTTPVLTKAVKVTVKFGK